MTSVFTSPNQIKFNLHLHSDLAQLINIELSDKHYARSFHPLALHLVRISSVYNKFALFILCITNLRWSDASRINFSIAVKNKFFNIIQNKTSGIVSVPLSLRVPELIDFIHFNDSIIEFSSYNSVSSEIKRLLRSISLPLSLNFNSRTHIFRHLNASFYASIGYDSDFIMNKLGHFSVSSQVQYIHRELFPEFIQQYL